MKKENLEDNLLAVKTAFKTIAGPMLAAVTGDAFVGTLGANLVFETLFGVHAEVKIQRVISFVEKLEKGIRKIDPDFDISKSDRVELWDLIEEGIRKASKANKEEKIERLKQVIVGQIIYDEDFDYVSRYLDLAMALNETQISILSVFVSTEPRIEKYHTNYKSVNAKRQGLTEKRDLRIAEIQLQKFRLKEDNQIIARFDKEIYETNLELSNLGKDFQAIIEERKKKLDSLKEQEYHFLMNDLRVLGLIYNPAEGKVSNTGDYAAFRCTALAFGLIKFLSST
ncbi:hypothetical protein [Flagellimonas allohymeniacidonis]|uniref:Uncharacterized protein n=1 Tax=Flagellimonas allohymeniacidonis TaxID=2517819 RepID=A0A4Q8QIB6_9FLAO|nr:hypothetical protein [Allomuricauda hymeniacidonis]TAI48988.1 hypothetical protein EW142_04110 [Allomuricauda hymeniacidonis]